MCPRCKSHNVSSISYPGFLGKYINEYRCRDCGYQWKKEICRIWPIEKK